MMQEEPYFFVNDFLEDRDQFEKVLDEIKKRPEDYTYKAQFLKNFVNGLYLAHSNINLDSKTKKDKLKEELKQKKIELVKRLEEIKNKKIEKQESKGEKKNLILSKITKKPIVYRELDKEYTIFEPTISSGDKTMIELIKMEMPKFDDDKLNTKIKERFGNIDAARFDALRYYAVRDLKSAGLISPLLEDEEVQEIICDGVNTNLIINMKTRKGVITNLVYKSDKEINDQLLIFSKLIGSNVSKDSPFLEGAINTNFMVDGNLSTEFFPGKFVIKRI